DALAAPFGAPDFEGIPLAGALRATVAGAFLFAVPVFALVVLAAAVGLAVVFLAPPSKGDRNTAVLNSQSTIAIVMAFVTNNVFQSNKRGIRLYLFHHGFWGTGSSFKSLNISARNPSSCAGLMPQGLRRFCRASR